MPSKKVKHIVSFYLLMTLLIASWSHFLIYCLGLPKIYSRLVVASPGLIALVFIVTKQFSSISFSDLSRQFALSRRVIKWSILAILIFPLLNYVSSALGSLVFGSTFYPVPSISIPMVKIFTIFILAVFEEIGWRGFALASLLPTKGLISSSLIIGVVWALWHLPGYLVGFGAPTDIPFWVFSLWVISATFLFSYFYLRSKGSIWTAILLHFSANLSLQFLPIMPSVAGSPATFVILVLLTCAIALAISIAYLHIRYEAI